MIKKWVFWGFLSVNCLLIIAAIAFALSKDYWPDFYFGEGFFITWWSVFQLAVIGLLSSFIFSIRVDRNILKFWKVSYLIWLLIAIGFFFLAYDEGWKFHEDLDKTIHGSLEMKETNLSDRLDDLILFLYGIIGIFFLLLYRKELALHKDVIPLLIIAIIIALLSVLLDAFNNRKDLIKMLIKTKSIYRPVNKWLCTLEDSMKLIVEAFLISIFYRIAETALSFRKNKTV